MIGQCLSHKQYQNGLVIYLCYQKHLFFIIIIIITIIIIIIIILISLTNDII